METAVKRGRAPADGLSGLGSPTAFRRCLWHGAGGATLNQTNEGSLLFKFCFQYINMQLGENEKE